MRAVYPPHLRRRVAGAVAAVRRARSSAAPRGAASLGSTAMALALLTTPLLAHRAARAPRARAAPAVPRRGSTAPCCWAAPQECSSSLHRLGARSRLRRRACGSTPVPRTCFDMVGALAAHGTRHTHTHTWALVWPLCAHTAAQCVCAQAFPMSLGLTRDAASSGSPRSAVALRRPRRRRRWHRTGAQRLGRLG